MGANTLRDKRLKYKSVRCKSLDVKVQRGGRLGGKSSKACKLQQHYYALNPYAPYPHTSKKLR